MIAMHEAGSGAEDGRSGARSRQVAARALRPQAARPAPALCPCEGEQQAVHVVDDHAEVRASIADLLRASGHRVVCHVDAAAFVHACPPQAAGCAILDVRMPGSSGLDLQRRMQEGGYALPVIVITAHAEVAMAARAFKAGAVDFIEKPFAAAELLRAVERALDADARLQARRRAAQARSARLSLLSGREREVLHAVVKGRCNKEIAAELGIVVSTVEAHRKRLADKLRASSLYELVRVAEADGG